MKKLLLSIASLGIATIAVNFSNYASAHDGNITSPHVDSKFEFPNTRWATVSQTIQVHIPQHSQALTQLEIDIPKNFDLQTSKIEINEGGRLIPAAISRQGQRLQIKFDRAIQPNTTLRIAFNGVKRNMLAQSSVYYLFDRTINGTTAFTGEAYFPQAD
jgi:hypothetical protein